MLWLILGLLCALFYAIYHIVNKKSIKISDPIYFAFCWMLFTALVTLTLVVLLWGKFVFNHISII